MDDDRYRKRRDAEIDRQIDARREVKWGEGCLLGTAGLRILPGDRACTPGVVLISFIPRL